LNQIFNRLLDPLCSAYMTNRYAKSADSLLTLSALKIRENAKMFIEDVETKLLKTSAIKMNAMENIIDSDGIKCKLSFMK
jgi:hypothetical protein